jgi:hypothetical protein
MNEKKGIRPGSQAWLALQLGISQPRVSTLVSEPDWPFARSSWSVKDVAAIRSYLQDRRATNNASIAADEDAGDDAAIAQIAAINRSPERVARIKYLIEQTAKVKLQRELLAGVYVRREDVEKERVARVFSVRSKLGELPGRAAQIAGRDATECERILADWVREICDYYATGGN